MTASAWRFRRWLSSTNVTWPDENANDKRSTLDTFFTARIELQRRFYDQTVPIRFLKLVKMVSITFKNFSDEPGVSKIQNTQNVHAQIWLFSSCALQTMVYSIAHEWQKVKERELHTWHVHFLENRHISLPEVPCGALETESATAKQAYPSLTCDTPFWMSGCWLKRHWRHRWHRHYRNGWPEVSASAASAA